MSSSGSILEAKELAIAAGGRRLIEGVDIELTTGEMLAMTGPSGCGKTSLLRAISGLDDPASGSIRFRGDSPLQTGWPDFRRHVVLIHQRPVMLDATVEENLMRPFRYRSVGMEFDRSLAVKLMNELSLRESQLHDPARRLSIGEQQRVSLIRALLIEPAVLLLDEPSSALDEQSRSALESVLIREIRRSRPERSAIVVTHDRVQGERLCDRMLDLEPYVVPADTSGGDGHAR